MFFRKYRTMESGFRQLSVPTAQSLTLQPNTAMNENTQEHENNELDVDLNSGEIIPDDQKKEYKTPEATKAGSLKKVSRAASGDSPTSSFPPGNSHKPAQSVPGGRC